MNIDFDLGKVTVTEFGVGRDDGNGQKFVFVPVDGEVQTALLEMVQATQVALQTHKDGLARYEPAEKYAATEYLYLPLEGDLSASVRDLHQATMLEVQSAALDDPADVFSYFARFTDQSNRRLTALRRATQFKGILKSRNRVVRMLDDTLKIVEDVLFKLDNDFDFLADNANIHILRPSGFEFAGRLQEAILCAVPENIKAIRKDLGFVEFNNIEKYAVKRPRAARYVASIRSQGGTQHIDKALLKKLCKQTDVKVSEVNGIIHVAADHEMGFLEVLDRRRYEVSLVKEKPERYRATSRRKIQN